METLVVHLSRSGLCFLNMTCSLMLLVSEECQKKGFRAVLLSLLIGLLTFC